MPDRNSDTIDLLVLCGGRSAEHQVSLQSASSVVAAVDPERFHVAVIGIRPEGVWTLLPADDFVTNADDPKAIALRREGIPVAVLPGGNNHEERGRFIALSAVPQPIPCDIVFPVLHGTYGEDGSVQGLLETAGIPYVGAGVLGSAVGMDKAVMKALLRDAGLPIGDFLTTTAAERKTCKWDAVSARLGSPVFVKPANLGSSVGITTAANEREFEQALDHAFTYDWKVVVEAHIEGREIECAVLGNEHPRSSLPGEIAPADKHGHYSYEAKYLDPDGASLMIPAKLSADTVARVQDVAVRAYQALCCEGLGRVDLFLCPDGKVLVNEINTLPGFTAISMYPKLWEATGLPFAELIALLAELAVTRAQRQAALATTR